MSVTLTNLEDESAPSLEVASTYLLDFFSTGGRSVLVRGDPGTGKTSLVLQLLDYHSKNGFKSVYMSTRLSAKTLKSHQPWVDVVQGKYGTVPRLADEQIGFQDSRRMDGVRAISGLRQYLEQVNNPFVVLDSWEGLFFESHMLGVEEISKLVEDYDARFVVVTERREQTDLDYLLDGVVVLRRKFHEGMIVREIELKKLRGVSIKQSRFLFTLDSGKFRYLPPISTYDFGGDSVGEPIPNLDSKTCSSGNKVLDSILEGGFKHGSLNLVEIANDVPTGARNLFFRTVFSNFVNTGHQILYVPFVGFAKGEIGDLLPNFSKETISSNVSTMWFDSSKSKKSDVLHGELVQDLELLYSKSEYMREESSKPVLAVFFEDAMEGLYGKESVAKELARSVTTLKANGTVRMQVTSPDSALLSELRAMCDSSLRIEMIHGTPVIFSTKPSSVLNGMVADMRNRGKVSLVPIV
ncbi:MAG TPA: ATPase domain-containing protein [Nitrososphaerales archaeon]|nr:ATPase domain-containing protein [Nitrososphaerales archaeon]